MGSLKNITLISLSFLAGYAVLSAAQDAAAVKTGALVETPAAWREDFSPSRGGGHGGFPSGWVLKGKPGTKKAEFFVASGDDSGKFYLSMNSDRSSASVLTDASGIDLTKTPIMRWRWKADILPEGADGRIRSRDDQAIGLYVGAGSVIDNRSISYRWDTDTPRNTEGSSIYGFGTVKIKWITLRNKSDFVPGRWLIEERDVAKDFKKAWGYIPDKIYLSVSCNSQYTNSRSAAGLEWIEFRPAAAE